MTRKIKQKRLGTGSGDTGTLFLADDQTYKAPSSVGGGTVTDVSIVTANGFSGSVANATTSPDITIACGAITPTSVNSVVLSGTSTPTLAVTGATAVSGDNTGDQPTFKTIAVASNDNVVADSATDTLTFINGSNVTITTNAAGDSITIAAAAGAQSLAFKNIAVSGQNTIIADDPEDTLTLVAGSNMTITTTAATDTITFTGANKGLPYAADAGANDAYVVTVSPAPVAYSVGDVYLFRANTANTGEPTLNINTLGIIPIKKKGNTALADNDILAKQMVEVAYNEVAGQTIDTYADDGAGDYLDTTTHGIGQSFTAIASKITSAKFTLLKSGLPEGNAVAKIYAHSGTYGTSSVPTGAALATSDNFDVSSLTGSPVIYTLTFSGANQIVLAHGTYYVLTLEYTGAVSEQTVEVRMDSSVPTHSGNRSTANTSFAWSAQSGEDLTFTVTGDQHRFEMLSPVAN